MVLGNPVQDFKFQWNCLCHQAVSVHHVPLPMFLDSYCHIIICKTKAVHIKTCSVCDTESKKPDYVFCLQLTCIVMMGPHFSLVRAVALVLIPDASLNPSNNMTV